MTLPDAAQWAAGRPRRSAITVALAAIGLGGFVIHQALTGPDAQSYATVGPGVFPLIVGCGLVLVGIGLMSQALRGAWRVTWMQADDASPRPKLLLVAAALLLDVALLQPLGFVLASSVLFVCVTRAFGSRRLALDAPIGLLFTGTIYLIFTRGLGVSLPPGRIWESLPWTF